MANAKNNVKLEFSTTIKLSETEIRALDALVGYGDDEFLKVFGEKLGTHYMRNYESGLRSFFKEVRTQVIPAISVIDSARDTIHKGLES